MNMRLLGAPTLKDVVPAMVDASSLSNHSVSVPEDRLFGVNCESFIVITPLLLEMTLESLAGSFDDPSCIDESLRGPLAATIKKGSTTSKL